MQPQTSLLRLTFLVLLALVSSQCGVIMPLHAQTNPADAGLVQTLIDSGSDSDQMFTGGIAQTIADLPGGDATVRYDPVGFSYTLPCDGMEPVALNFVWIEPTVKAVGARLFTVKVNDQVAYDKIDIFAIAGYRVPVARSMLAFCANGQVTIKFSTQVRSAMISRLMAYPFALTQYIKPMDPQTARVTGAPAQWAAIPAPDGTSTWQGYLAPRPASVTDATVALTYVDVGVYRNGLRLTAGVDIWLSTINGQLAIAGLTSTDTITVDYTAILPPAFTLVIGPSKSAGTWPGTFWQPMVEPGL